MEFGKPGDKWGWLTGTCKTCLKYKRLAKRESIGNGHYKYHKYCVDCYAKYGSGYRKKYTKSKKGKKQKKKNNTGEKYKARLLVQEYVRAGKLFKPNSCSNCGGDSKRIEAHHPDYSKPLAVVWLCTICHAIAHRDKVKFDV